MATPARTFGDFMEPHLDLLNKLLRESTALGAYLMGAACSACFQAGVPLDDQLLRAVRSAAGVHSAMVIINRWIAEHGEQNGGL